MWDPVINRAKDISPPVSEAPQDRTNREAANIFCDDKNLNSVFKKNIN